MASGLQVFNADGSVQLDTTTYTMLTLATFDTGASAGSTTFNNPSSGTVTVAQVDLGDPTSTPHTLSVSGNTVSWSGGNANSKVRVFLL